MDKLKPCPFCGGEPTVSYYHTQSLFSSNEVQFTKVGCDECDVAFNSEPDFETDAITAWNTRAVTDEMAECIKVHRTDRALTAASLRAMAGGDDGEV